MWKEAVMEYFKELIYGVCLENLKKFMKTAVRIVDALAETGTQHLNSR
jgi:hypothetical protein